MKNTIKLFGVIALAAIIGFSMVSCIDLDDDGGSGSGGMFTLTGIPAEYNGKYAGTYQCWVNGGILMGYQSRSRSDIKYTKISNGSVSIPMWIGTEPNFRRYTGNDTASSLLGFSVMIYNSSTGNQFASLTFDPVTFSNGSATRQWNDGYLAR